MIFDEAKEELKRLMDERNIPYIIEKIDNGDHHGYQVRFKGIHGDVVCSTFSYGGDKGLWESMGFTDDQGDTTGWLTAEEVVEMVIEELMKFDQWNKEVSISENH